MAVANGGCADARSRAVLAQPIPPLRVSARPLQAVVHDVLERSPRGGAVRVCRALADVSVSFESQEPTSLDGVLRSLARQAGTELTTASSDRELEPLPTLPCPTAEGDYLVVGRPPR